MEEASGLNGHHVTSLIIEDASPFSHNEGPSRYCFTACFIQMLIAELIGTYFLVFAGCAAIVVNLNTDRVVTLLGIAIVWGLVLMVMIDWHPAKCFHWNRFPAYISLQILGSILASGTLRLLFQGKQNQFAGTIPAGSELQSLVVEFAITFLFRFAISSLTTDNQATKSFAGLVIGATLSINVLIAGGISEPSKEFGASNCFKSLQGAMDIYSRSNIQGHSRCLGLQNHQPS